MKKLLSIISIFVIAFTILFTINVYAATLDGVNITTSKEKINPGENVVVNIAFGRDLGSYTFDVAYDNNLFEYVSAEGGTANDNGTRVRVYFFDSTGGTAPRTNMSVTFKAKDVLTSNPTDFSITAEGLANADASETYDDITTPIVKNVVVEPNFVDYDIALSYSGEVIKDVEKDMKLVISSPMGKNYEHTRIIAEATTPSNATVKLLATDSASLEHDIIQSGWGDASGDQIGGKDVKKELAVRGLFSDIGKYTITFKLIDRDDSDAVIATKTVEVNVKEKETTEQKPSEENNGGTTNGTETNKPSQNKPTKLPQTGNTVYVYALPVIAILGATFVALKRKD